jgi:hypothetical protein
MLEPDLPADDPAAAVGGVAVGHGRPSLAMVAGGPAHGRAGSGDFAGIAFNAQVVTVAAQIVAAEAAR